MLANSNEISEELEETLANYNIYVIMGSTTARPPSSRNQRSAVKGLFLGNTYPLEASDFWGTKATLKAGQRRPLIKVQSRFLAHALLLSSL